jgi:hypothetical protein
MTPAEFHSVLEARSKLKERDREELDKLNAKLCEILVKAPYFKEPLSQTPKDFMIFGTGDDEPVKDMTPDGILGRAFGNLSKIGDENG